MERSRGRMEMGDGEGEGWRWGTGRGKDGDGGWRGEGGKGEGGGERELAKSREREKHLDAQGGLQHGLWQPLPFRGVSERRHSPLSRANVSLFNSGASRPVGTGLHTLLVLGDSSGIQSGRKLQQYMNTGQKQLPASFRMDV